MTKGMFCRWIVARGLRVFPGVFLLVGASSAEPVEQQHIRAAQVETLLDGTETLRNYRGGVSFEDALRGIYIQADSMHLRVQRDHYAFVRGVSYRDSIRQVRADTLIFSQQEQRAEFRGRVFLSDGDRLLRAHRVQYDIQGRRLTAQIRVEFVQTEKKQMLETPFLAYDLDADSGRTQGRTRIAMSGDGADTLVALADSVAFQGQVIALGGDVRIFQKGLSARAAVASFSDTLLLLSGQPEVTWRRENADSISGSAERIGFDLGDLRVRAVRFETNAELHLTATDSQSITIVADSARIALSGDSLSYIGARREINAVLAGKGEMTLHGDALDLFFSEGQPDSLAMLGNAESTYVPEDGASRSRLLGQKQEMRFRDRSLVRALVLGEARCEYEKDDGIHLSGDWLLLWFEDGALRRVEADGGVRGKYKEPLP